MHKSYDWEKKMFTSCDMIENPTEKIAFGGNGGGTVVGLW
jgi:hypothetical protein